ncbi:CRP/FNR family transcriptional regulator [Oceanihabitans sediminis]|uniref:Crp/Fnr family transcriptional regulator n=1 Tax=Oceanihabitans sediminis TaxID=1812012 RepID=A0A368P763_9FLAO|nr:Crp/Fnr family transcriptional regulator [Oceanihabitans sediminis]MDX1773385.1 Crp/Fnr family transcriptional regulator [Oceanihabitans sediminis]RBP32841.1 CRP/FNR family transcriptional regulator [Oceanihabitans sediminis]RCU57629.1 Crp/Fnr family transcriptional regulator [Oceanihabitans sediminis]
MKPNINNFDCNSHFNTLRNNKLFNHASNESINALLNQCRLETFEKGECIINKKKTLYKFYYMINGKIKVFNLNQETDKHYTLFLLLKDDVFDVFSLISKHQHNVCYEVLEDTELLVFSCETIREWLLKNPIILNELFKYTIQKLQVLEYHLLDLGTNGLLVRLANLLLENYNINTQQIENINNLTHKELAELIGTTRAVFNRHIQALKKEGIIRIERKNIYVIDVKLLIEKSSKSNFID